jgi:pimeloyl-ACP methyl ester carboxylesterase
MFPLPEFIESNGIRLATYQQGEGPAVILLHGFPELAFSWRFQLPVLADAGYRAIAVDQRGYGRSDVPSDVADYGIDDLIGDITGLLDALGLEKAVFVGHDWGALVLWHLALLEPQRVERLAALGIPFWPRAPIDPIDLARQALGDEFYIVNFQDSDEADRLFESDPEHFFDMLMRKDQVSRAEFERLPPEKKVLSLKATFARSESGGEPLLNDEERAYYANAFRRTGFTGAINWYRNWSANWRRMEGVEQLVKAPTLFIGAEDDVIISPEHIENMKPFVPNLEIHMLENTGHWSQQEKPGAVNRILIDWLST